MRFLLLKLEFENDIPRGSVRPTPASSPSHSCKNEITYEWFFFGKKQIKHYIEIYIVFYHLLIHVVNIWFILTPNSSGRKDVHLKINNDRGSELNISKELKPFQIIWYKKTLWWHKFTLQPQVWYFSSRSRKTSLCIGFGSKPTEQILRRSLNWKNLFRNPLYLSTQPLSNGTKELVKYRQDKGIWEQVRLIELANLDPNVGAHV